MDANSALARRATWTAVAVAITIFALASFLTTRSTLFDRDEPRFAQAAVEMVHSGNWLYPTFNGELRADKPILVYWLMSATIRWFGAGEWSVRFWSPASLSLASFVVFLVGRRFFGATAGLLAMAMLALSPLALIEGTIATTDALLLLCVTSATASLAFVIADGAKFPHFVLFAITCCAALLTKGPVGLAIPLLSVALAAWMLRGRGILGRRFACGVALSTCLALGVALAWAMPANAATHGEFARRGLGHHVVERMTTPLESHGGNFFVSLPFYVPVVIFGFLPWIAYLPAAISAALGGRLGGERGRTLLVAWIVPCFVLMSLVSTKLAHYVLPIWPGLALACAAVIVAAERDQLSARDRRWLARGIWFLAVPAALVVALLVAAPSIANIPDLRMPALTMAVVFAATVMIGIRFHRAGAWRRSAVALIVGSAITWVAGVTLTMPVIERTKVAPVLATIIRRRTHADVPIARYKFVEPSLDFYLGRSPIQELADESALDAWAAADSPAILVLPRDRLEGRKTSFSAAKYVEIGSARGFNVSKGKELELVALGRNLPERPR